MMGLKSRPLAVRVSARETRDPYAASLDGHGLPDVTLWVYNEISNTKDNIFTTLTIELILFA
jgi:hypothetical protein